MFGLNRKFRMNDIEIKHFGVDLQRFPKPDGVTYREYHTMFPNVPTGILKCYFPNLKPHDISNFMKSLPNKDKARFKNRGTLTGLSTNQAPHIIKDNLRNKMKVYLRDELNITEQDVDQGLTSEQAHTLARKKMSTNYKQDKKCVAFISARYLDKEVDKKRITKGQTLFYTFLKTFWPGKNTLKRAHLHPIMFQQSKAKSVEMEDLLQALKMYYRYHHPAMQRAERLYTNQKNTSTEQMTEKLWEYWCVQISSKSNNFFTAKALADWGFTNNMFKHVVSSYLEKLHQGSSTDRVLREGLLNRHTESGGRLLYTSVVHELLSFQVGQQYVDSAPSWNAKLFKKQNPQLQHRCVGCGDTRAIEWHHIAERAKYPSRTYDSSNVIPICAHVHSMITRKSFQNEEYNIARNCFIDSGDQAEIIKWVKNAHIIPNTNEE